MGHRLVLALGLSGSLMTASSGLGQLAESVGMTAKPPKNTVIATVKVGGNPSAIVVSLDNKTVYVANYLSSSVSVLDATNNYAVKGTATVGHYPNYLAISPDGNTLYVACFADPGAVSVVDTTQPTYPTKTTLTVGPYPYGLAVTPDGKELYVAGPSEPYGPQGTVSVFDTSTNTLTTTLQPGGSPYQFVFTNKGKQADLLNYGGGGFLQFISTVSGKLSSSTGAGGRMFLPSGMTSDASGSTLYITNEFSYVIVCDAKDGKVTNEFLVAPSIATNMYLGQPAITPNGKYLYVSFIYNNSTGQNEHQVQMFDVSTGKAVGTPITVGNHPFWAQMAPNGNTLYVANGEDATVTVIDTTP
jgi:YVTN family beta-propeller protein